MILLTIQFKNLTIWYQSHSSANMSKYSADIEKIATQVEEMKTQVRQIAELKAQQELFQESMTRQFQAIMAVLLPKSSEQPSSSEAPNTETLQHEHATTDNDATATTKVITTIQEKRGELLPFVGENPEHWLLEAEKYFSLNDTPESERMKTIVMFLDGEALAWFAYTQKHDKIKDWQDFRLRIERRWQGCEPDEALEQLMAIKQDGTVMAYRTEFERLSSLISDLQPNFLERAFLKGLKPEIRDHIDIIKPTGLPALMDAAMKMEKHLHSVWHAMRAPTAPEKSIKPTTTSRPSKKYIGSSSSTNYDRGKQTSTESNPRTVNVNSSHRQKRQLRLTDAEFQDRRDKGLCFHCEEKFNPGHKCKKQLNILIVHDEDEDFTDTTESDWSPADGETVTTNSIFTACVSCNSVSGLSKHSTMKLEGELFDQRIVILIDPGATHNFICKTTARELKLPIMSVNTYRIVLGDGPVVYGKGIYKDLSIIFQGIMVTDDFLPLTLTSVHVILGKQWLDSIGWVHNHFRNLIMKFIVEGQVHTLYGDPLLHRALIEPKHADKDVFAGSVFMAELYLIEEDQDLLAVPATPISIRLREEFPEVFTEITRMPPPRDIDHAITLLPGAPIVNKRPYRYSFAQKNEIERLIKEMLAAGIIQHSKSPYASPILLVQKRNASWRICVDYRSLNKLTIPERYPIPVVDELIDELHGSVIFSKLDLRSGYYQIRMKEEDIPKTAFRTHEGHYEFKVMPFGLSNAPSTFQALMNHIFRPHLRQFVLVFFDDILIYSKSEELHEEHLLTVFTLLKQNQLHVNADKCFICQQRLEYLGHWLSAEGVDTDEGKILAIRKWPKPKSIRDIRSFSGLAGYYRKFVKNYASIAAPLFQMTKGNTLQWTLAAEESFQKLNQDLICTPVLALPDFTQPFVIETDASLVGIGAVLMQNGRPIAYYSHGLPRSKVPKSSYEIELFAVVMSVQKWKHYLIHLPFTIRTDQISLKYLWEQKEIPSQFAKWMIKLMGFQFTVEYRQGRTNKVADALSRVTYEQEAACNEVSVLLTPAVEAIKQEFIKDPDLKKIIDVLKQDPSSMDNYTYYHGQLLYKGRLVIPKNSAYVNTILSDFHHSAIGGHLGYLKTYKRIMAQFYWIGMKADIKRHVNECQVCQVNKASTLAPAGLLQPLPIPHQIFEDVTMDFVEALPRSDGYDTVWVIVDRLSKYSHFIPLKHPFNAYSLAKIFIREFVRLHGIPKSIVSDRGRFFMGLFWKEIHRLQGTKLNFTSAYHPESDGQTEVVNKWLANYLRCFTSTRPHKWSMWLSWAELCYNTSYHVSSKMTPFKIVYGRDPPTIIRYGNPKSPLAEIDTYLSERDNTLRSLKQHLSDAQAIMKEHKDTKRRDCNLKEGDLVYLKIRPYRMK